MKSKKSIIILLIICLIIIIGIVGIYFCNVNVESNLENSDLKENNIDLELRGEKYNPSKVYDEVNKEISLENFSDKPMVLLFFNTTQIEAVEALKILQNNYEKYKEEVNFVNISIIDGINETELDIKEYIAVNNITMPVFYDTEYITKKEYEINEIPTFIFINKNNEIINSIHEDINQDVIEANLDIISENY